MLNWIAVKNEQGLRDAGQKACFGRRRLGASILHPDTLIMRAASNAQAAQSGVARLFCRVLPCTRRVGKKLTHPWGCLTNERRCCESRLFIEPDAGNEDVWGENDADRAFAKKIFFTADDAPLNGHRLSFERE